MDRKTLRILLPLLGALICLPSSAQVRGDTPRVTGIEIFEHGIYQTQTSQKIKDPTAPTGQRGVVVDVTLQQSTNIIPADYEVEFGIRYEVKGGPADAVVPVTLVLRFPAPGLKEPGKAPVTEYRSVGYAKIGSTENFQSYGFDWPWEIVPGVWTFELWYQGKKMTEQKFTVVE